MKLIKYHSIESSYRRLFIDKIISEGKSDGDWVVQEKIHGSCLSIVHDGVNYYYQSRNRILSEEENFQGCHQQIVEQYKERFELLCRKIKLDYDCETVVIYGELFGGSYPHPDVKKDANAKQIQKGIWYCPHNDFIGFDIMVDSVYLPIKECDKYFADFYILYARTLYKGTLLQCLNFKNEFLTNIPYIFGLPHIENNICEGVVIKPDNCKFLNSGERVILKNKNDKWSEKVREPKNPVVLSDEIQNICTKLDDYITENRLKNVLSKIGEVTNNDFGKILGEFNKDVMEEYVKDNDDLDQLEKSDRKSISKLLNEKSAGLVRRNFLNIIDGSF